METSAAEHISHLREHGYVVIPDVIPPDRLEEFRELSYERYRARAANPGTERIHDLAYYEHDERFLDLFDWPATFDLVRAVLGDNLAIYHAHLDVHPQNSVDSYFWHQDISIISEDCGALGAPIFLKVGYYLTDVETEAHGATRVQAGSHLGKAYDPDDPGLPLTTKAGSAVIFDHRLWHTRGLNTTPEDRLAIFVAYSYRWMRRRDEFEGLVDSSMEPGKALRALLPILKPER